MKKIIFAFLFISLSAFIVSRLFSHCQIPCGIYDDNMRFSMIEEHIKTIEKSMNEIVKLSKEGDKNYNQIVRWIVNKEEHADELSHIVSFYFMAQRLTLTDKKDSKEYKEYLNKLTLLHGLLVYAMKAKQTTDLDNVEKLKALTSSFRSAYLNHSH